MFGFLNCAGSVNDKSDVLYSIFQEGGVEKQSFLSAGDKDIKPALTKLMNLCTLELVELMQEVDGTHPMDIEDKADDIDYAHDDLIEFNYLEQLYGTLSKLNYDEWMRESSKKKAISQIWYEPQRLRMLVFTKAGVEVPETEDFKSFCAKEKIPIEEEQ